MLPPSLHPTSIYFGGFAASSLVTRPSCLTPTNLFLKKSAHVRGLARSISLSFFYVEFALVFVVVVVVVVPKRLGTCTKVSMPLQAQDVGVMRENGKGGDGWGPGTA